MSDSLGYAVLRTELDRSGLSAGLQQARADATTHLNALEGQTKKTVGGIRQAFDSLTTVNLGGILGTAGAIAGLRALAQEAFQVETGMRLLDRQLERNNISFSEGRDAIAEVAEELHVLPSAIADNVAQLLRQGLTMEEISEAFRGGAASALAFGKSAATGVDTVTSAIITGRSALLDSIGISQNLDIAYKAYADTLGTTVDALDSVQRAQAAVHLITRYTKEEVEDLPVMLQGLGGASSDLQRNLQSLRIEIGNELLPTVTALTNGLATAAGWLADLPEPVMRFGSGAAIAATGLTALGTAVGVLRVALMGLGGPAGIVLAVASAVGGLVALMVGQGSGGVNLETAINRVKVAASSTAAIDNLDTSLTDLANSLTGPVKRAFESAREDIWSIVTAAEDARDALARISLGAELANMVQGDWDLNSAIQSRILIPGPGETAADMGSQQASHRLREALLTGDFGAAQEVVRELIQSFSDIGASADVDKLTEFLVTLQRAEQELVTYTQRTNAPGPSASGGGGGGGGGKTTSERTPEQVFADLEAAGIAAEREALAFGNTTDARLRSVETRAGLVQSAISELIQDFDFDPLSDEIQYLVGRMLELNKAAEELGAAPEAMPGSLSYLNELLAAAQQAVLDAPTAEAARVANEYVQRIQEAIRRMTPIELALPEVYVRVLLPEEDARERRRRNQWQARLGDDTPPTRDPSERFADRAALEAVRARQERERNEALRDYLRSMERLVNLQESLSEGSEVVGDTSAYEDVRAVMRNMRQELRNLDEQAAIFGDTEDLTAQKAEVLRRAIVTLSERGFARQGAILRPLIEDYNELIASMEMTSERQLQIAEHQRWLTRSDFATNERFGTPEARDAYTDYALQRSGLPTARDFQAAQDSAGRIVFDDFTLQQMGRQQRELSNQADIYDNYRQQLRAVNQEAEIFGVTQEVMERRASLTRDAIVNLVAAGMDPQSRIVQQLTADYEQMTDAAAINADTVRAQAEATERAAQTQRTFASAMEQASAMLGEAPTALESLVAVLEAARDSGSLTDEQMTEVEETLARLNDLAEDGALAEAFEAAADKVEAVGNALTALFSIDWDNGNSILSGLTESLSSIASIIPGLGPVAAGIISTIGNTLNAVLGDMRNGMAGVKDDLDDIQDRFQLIDVADLVQIKQTSRGGLLGLLGFTYSEVDQEASELGLSIAESIESGVMGGLRNGLNAFLETGDVRKLEFAIQEGLYEGVTNALLTAIVEQGVIQSILGPKLLELAEAVAAGYQTGDYGWATRVLGEIQSAVPEIAKQLAPLLGDLRELRPTDPTAPPDAPGSGGRQYSELSGPTRDLFTDLLTPLASLVSVPSILQAQLAVQERMLRVLGGDASDLPLGRPPWLGLLQQDTSPRGAGPDGELVPMVIHELNMRTDARSARELYRDISSWHTNNTRGRRR